jgi:hypothetical protein
LRSRSREIKSRLQALAFRKDRAAARRPEFLVQAILDRLKVRNNGTPMDLNTRQVLCAQAAGADAEEKQ